MRIIGLDPGLVTTGYGVIEVVGGKESYLTCGAIKTTQGLTTAAALDQLRRELVVILRKWQPALAIVEKLYVVRNLTTAMRVGEARGVIMQLLQEQGIGISECTPTAVKGAIVGYGQADKRQVQLMVQRWLNLNFLPKPADAADGLALALVGSHQQVGRRLTSQTKTVMLETT